MRTLSTAGQNAIDERLGGEPIRYIEIQWNDGTLSRHADKVIPGFAEGDILSLSPITQTQNYNGNLSNMQFSVTLNDTTGYLKSLFDRYNIHKRPCVLKQWFTGIPLSDSFELFRGQIFSPITWSEGQRTLSFDIVTPVYGREVGFSIEEGQFQSVPEKLTGKAWPLCFGSVLNVPCTLSSDIPTGSVGALFGVPDATLPWKKKYMENQLALIGQSFGVYRMLEERCHMATLDYDILSQTITITGDILATTKFVVSTSGVTSDPILVTISGLEAFTKFLNEAIDFAVVQIDASSPGSASSINPSDVQVSHTTGDNGTGLTDVVRTITVTNWPYPISIESFQTTGTLIAKKNPTPVNITCEITAVEMEDGSIKDASQLREAILQRPDVVRKEYIDTIKLEDQLKQELEDLQLELNNNFKSYQSLLDLYNEDRTDFAVKAKLVAIQAARQEKVKAAQAKHLELWQTTYDKKKLEIDIQNLTLVFDTIGKVRNKQKEILDAYVSLKKSYARLVEIIDNQVDRLGNTTVVSGHQYFPQGTQDVAVGRAKFSGNLVGKQFTGTAIRFDYVDVLIDSRESSEIDTFWIKDDTLDLKGKFCRLGNGRIIKVTDQVGRQCRFSPTRTGDSTRNRNKEFPLTGPHTEALRKGLGDLLTGNETNAELLWLLNTLPKDISKASKNRLTGGVPLQTTISLKGAMPILTSTDPNYFSPGTLRAESIGINASTYYITYSEGFFSIAATTRLTLDCDASTIEAAILAGTTLKKGDISVTGGPLLSADKSTMEDVIITITNPDIVGFFGARSVDYDANSAVGYVSTLKYNPQDADDATDEAAKLIVNASSYIAGAYEYTKKTRDAKIQGAIDSSKYGKELGKVQSRIKQLIRDIEAFTLDGNATDALKVGLQQKQAQYQSMLGLIQIPKGVTEEANRPISNEEYKNIFQCELMQYLYVRRYIDDIGNNLPDPADEYYFTGRDITYISQVSEIIPPFWLDYLGGLDFETFMDEVRMLPDAEAWVGNIGDVITNDANFQETYVANILPSSIRSVMAYKNEGGYRRLVPVPTAYYSKNESYAYGPMLCTIITLRRPLREYKDENWEDGIYVSLVSSVGPNPVDVIEYLLGAYTTLVPDATSFDAVRTKLSNYPTHFAVLDKKDSLQLIEDIAYQSRCAVWVVSGVMHITYLPEYTSPVMTITESDIEVNSFELTLTDTENLVTKSVSTYVTDYVQESPYQLILRANLNRYGEQVDTYDYYALTNRGLVEKTATYWMIQKANTWKQVRFKGMLNLLKLEPFDIVLLNLSSPFVASDGGSDYSISCRVMNISYDSDDESVGITLWVPIRAGEMAQFQFAWPSGLTATDIYPTLEDAITGNAGNDFNSDVPLGVAYNPYDNSLLAFRPNDYGDITPTDSTDVEPLDPIDGIEEVDGKAVDIANFQMPDPPALAPADKEVDMAGQPAIKPPAEVEIENSPVFEWKDLTQNAGKVFDGTVTDILEPVQTVNASGDYKWIPVVFVSIEDGEDNIEVWDDRHMDSTEAKARGRFCVGDAVKFSYSKTSGRLIITQQRRTTAK